MSETFEQVSVSDIVERLKEPEIHYPGNFDTPKRANAVLSCLCQEAAEEIESLHQQLAASQAREQQLREALHHSLGAWHYDGVSEEHGSIFQEASYRCDSPADASALAAMIKKAGEVMRERAIKAGRSVNPIYGASVAIDAIHLLPQITIDDIK